MKLTQPKEMKFMPATGLVTVPNRQEMQEIVDDYGIPSLSDFAIATGAKCAGLQRNLLMGFFNYGQNWLREPAGAAAPAGVAVHGRGFSDGYAYANAGYVTVLPRFQNPEALDLDLMSLDGVSYLTHKGALSYYPDVFMGEKVDQQLTHILQNPSGDQAMQPVGAYSMPDDFNCRRKTVKCYNYQGRNYAYLPQVRPYDQNSVFNDATPCRAGRGHWFLCRPVRAVRCADGSIQCLDQLITCPFDTQNKYHTRGATPEAAVDTNDFFLGNFLNGGLLIDLMLSTRFHDRQINHKLTQVDAQYRKVALKRQIKDLLHKCPDPEMGV